MSDAEGQEVGGRFCQRLGKPGKAWEFGRCSFAGENLTESGQESRKYLGRNTANIIAEKMRS